MSATIDIVNKEHFREAVAFARKLGGKPKKSFIRCLHTLNRIRHIKRNGVAKLQIRPDFVKHSFHFQMIGEHGEHFMNGGMILHGFEETYSVELTSKNYPHWSIHT